ncbi:uncharacterized protein LOC115307205 [Manacus vitellinus]|uniref:uncharacterized protein LOC115307205 n=1 Tax=Manacus vitellinus TaxID=328815 RepID=UPI00115EE647|nr:uncharacterized protein LOC115307205 [Manacus vitellinus]
MNFGYKLPPDEPKMINPSHHAELSNLLCAVPAFYFQAPITTLISASNQRNKWKTKGIKRKTRETVRKQQQRYYPPERPSRSQSIPRRCHQLCPSLRPGSGSDLPRPLFFPGNCTLDPVPPCQALEAFGLGSRVLLEKAARERGLAGAWAAGISLLCSAASQKRSPRHRAVPVAAGEQTSIRRHPSEGSSHFVRLHEGLQTQASSGYTRE